MPGKRVGRARVVLFWQACMLMWLFGIASAVQASVAVTLEEGGSRYIVPDRNLWHRLVEPLDNPSHVELLRGFERSAGAETSLVGQRGPFVARLTLNPTGQVNEQWYLLFNANYIDQGVAYWKPEAGPPVALDEFSQLNDSRTPRLLHYQAISLPLAPGGKGEILIYINALHYAGPFALELMNQHEFMQYQFVVNSGSIAAISVMLTLTLIALILFWRTRYWVTLACAGYVGLHALGWTAASGLLDDVFGWTFWNTTYAGMLLFPFAIACASQFTRLLFNDRKNYRRTARYLNLLSISTLCLGGLMLWLPFWLAFALAHAVASLWVVTTLCVGVLMLRQDDFRAKYYLLGNAVYASSLVFYMLSHASTDMRSFSPEMVVLIALAFDCLCILMSTAEWLNIRKKEYGRSYHYARIDSLTQVGNRYALNERLNTVQGRVLLAFIDLDGMKGVNDRCGHSEGDRLLQETARQMGLVLDNQMSVYRTGGDEFVWLAEANDPQAIIRLTESLAGRVFQVEQALHMKGWGEIGISFGSANSMEADTISHCLMLADQRMYAHKQSKSRVSREQQENVL